MKPTPKRYVYITRSKTGNRNWIVRYSRKHRSATAATFDSWRYEYADVLHWVNSQGVYLLQLPPEQRREIAEKKKEQIKIQAQNEQDRYTALMNERELRERRQLEQRDFGRSQPLPFHGGRPRR